MENKPDNKKEAPGAPTQKGKVELPGQQPDKEEKKKKDEEAAGPLSQEDYGNQKNQSGKNTSPDSED